MDVSPNVYQKLVGKCVRDLRRVRDSHLNATLALNQHFITFFKIVEANQTEKGEFHCILPRKCSQLHIEDVRVRPPFL